MALEHDARDDADHCANLRWDSAPTVDPVNWAESAAHRARRNLALRLRVSVVHRKVHEGHIAIAVRGSVNGPSIDRHWESPVERPLGDRHTWQGWHMDFDLVRAAEEELLTADHGAGAHAGSLPCTEFTETRDCRDEKRCLAGLRHRAPGTQLPARRGASSRRQGWKTPRALRRARRLREGSPNATWI
jgi:hypothetical protein